jgi:hypothetical protein
MPTLPLCSGKVPCAQRQGPVLVWMDISAIFEQHFCDVQVIYFDGLEQRHFVLLSLALTLAPADSNIATAFVAVLNRSEEHEFF